MQKGFTILVASPERCNKGLTSKGLQVMQELQGKGRPFSPPL